MSYKGSNLDILKTIMSNAGISVKHLAFMIDQPQTTIQNYIYGHGCHGYLPIEHGIAIAEALGISLDYVYGANDARPEDIDIDSLKETVYALLTKKYEEILNSKDSEYTIDLVPWPYNIMEQTIGTKLTVPATSDQINGLNMAIATLSERDQKICRMRYEQMMTLDDIGATYDITRERVRQIVNKIIRKLQRPTCTNYILYGESGSEYLKVLNDKAKELKRREEQLDRLQSELNMRIAASFGSNEVLNIPVSATTQSDIMNKRGEHRSYMYKIAEDDCSKEFLELELSVRSFNCLSRAHARTVEKVVELIENDGLIKLRNLGRKSYEEIVTKVKKSTGLEFNTNAISA